MFTRASRMNLRSTAVVKRGSRAQDDSKKKAASTVSTASKERQPSSPKKGGSTKKSTPDEDNAKRQAVSKKRSNSIDNSDDNKTDISETGSSEIGDPNNLRYSRILDGKTSTFEVDGYRFGVDGHNRNNSLYLRCLFEGCKMRGVAYRRDYNGPKKIPKLPANDPRAVIILKPGNHNHPPRKPKATREKSSQSGSKNLKKSLETGAKVTRTGPKKSTAAGKEDGDQGNEESDEDEDEGETDKDEDDEEVENSDQSCDTASNGDEKEEKPTDDGSANKDASTKPKPAGNTSSRGGRKNRSPSPKKTSILALGRGRRTKENASKAWEWLKKKGTFYPEGNEQVPVPKKRKMKEPESTKPVPSTTTTPMTISAKKTRDLTLMQKLRKNALQRYNAQKRQKPSVMIGSAKVSGILTLPTSKGFVAGSSSISSSSSSKDDVMLNESAFTFPVSVYEDKYYVMDGYAYLKEKDCRNGGITLHCVDRLNCKARAMAIWKRDEKNGGFALFARYTNPKHSHERSAPGHGDDEEGSSDIIDDLATIVNADNEQIITSTNWGMTGEYEYEESTSTTTHTDAIPPRGSSLPPSIDLRQMAENYVYGLRTLIEFQDGVSVDSHPALVRLKEKPGEELIEFLTNEDLIDAGDDIGVDEKALHLFNNELKHYRALYDLLALSLDDFLKIIDAYERWLKPDCANLWWNTGDMLEFIVRRLLRSEKYRDTYASALLKSQGSSCLRFMGRPVLPLPEPSFLRGPGNSVRNHEMRESLINLKATIDTLQSGVKGEEIYTVELVLREFDDAANSFFSFFAQNEDRVSKESPPEVKPNRIGRPRKDPESEDSKSVINVENKPERKSSTLKRKASAVSVETQKPTKRAKTDNGATLKRSNQHLKEFIFKPTKSALREIFHRYIYCLNTIWSYQKENNFTRTPMHFITEYIGSNEEEKMDGKFLAYYHSLRMYRAVCDLLVLAPAHAVHVVKWFQKRMVPADKRDIWKSSYAFDLVCRRILCTSPHKDWYVKARAALGKNVDVSSLREPPLLPFRGPFFVSTNRFSVAEFKRMRSLALSRRISDLYGTESGRIKAQDLLTQIDLATEDFFNYLQHNDAWPMKGDRLIYLSQTNGEGDLFERLDRELTILDSYCAKKTPTDDGNEGLKKPAISEKGKVGRPKNGRTKKNGKKRVAQPTEKRATSPNRLVFNMNETYCMIEEIMSEVNNLETVTEALPATKLERRSTTGQSSEAARCLNIHDRYIETVLKELSHLDAVLTLSQLARLVQNCRFEHVSFGEVVISQGRIVTCGGTPCTDPAMLAEIGNRRVTLGISDLPSCVPLSKIDLDKETRTLRLDGMAVETKPK